jgi:UDP-2,3-diacylglucosamine pyrophosphatase LpxH
MPRDINKTERFPLYYPVVVISDLHLGKRKVVDADLLLEFLENITCDTLILNGDIIDGWYLEKHDSRPFPEKHARVLDALNRHAAEGVRVIYIPGNHDERLRYRSSKEMEKKRLSREKPMFQRKINFRINSGISSVACEFMSDMILMDNAGRRMKVLHGDIFDPPWVEGTWAKIGDAAYDALVIANAKFAELSKKFRKGVRFSIAKLIKKSTKHAIGIINNFESAAVALPPEIDGMICGHIHHAEVSRLHGKLYVNSGDWIESCTAAVQNEAGHWSILDWEAVRAHIPLSTRCLFTLANRNKAYRPVTQRQLRLIRYFWPARNAFDRRDPQYNEKEFMVDA